MSNKIKLLSIWIIWSLSINFQYGSNHQQPTGLSFNKILKVFSLLAMKQTLAQVTLEIKPMEYGVVGLDYYTSFLDADENCQVYQLDNSYKLKTIFKTQDPSCVVKCFVNNVDLPNIRDGFGCVTVETLPSQEQLKGPNGVVSLSNRYLTGLSTDGTKCEVNFLKNNIKQTLPSKMIGSTNSAAVTETQIPYKFYNEDNCQNYCSSQLFGVYLTTPSPFLNIFCHSLERITTSTNPVTEEYRMAHWSANNKCVLKIFDTKMGLRYIYTSDNPSCSESTCFVEDIYELSETVILQDGFTCDKKPAAPTLTIDDFGVNWVNSMCFLGFSSSNAPAPFVSDPSCDANSCTIQNLFNLYGTNPGSLDNGFSCTQGTSTERTIETIHRFTSFVTNSQCILKKSNYRNQEIEKFTTSIVSNPNCRQNCNVEAILDYQTTLKKTLADNFDCPVENNPSAIAVDPSNKNDNYKSVVFNSNNGLCFFSDSTLTDDTCLYPIKPINYSDISNKINKNKILGVIDQIVNEKLIFTLNSGENIVVLLENLVEAMNENRPVVYEDQEKTYQQMLTIIHEKTNYYYGKAQIGDLIADNIDTNNYCYQMASPFCGSDSCTLDKLKTNTPSTMNFLCNNNGLKLVEANKVESIVFESNTCLYSTGLGNKDKCNYLDSNGVIKSANIGSLVTDHKTDNNRVCYTWSSIDPTCKKSNCNGDLLKNINKDNFKCWTASQDGNGICYITQGQSLYKDCSVAKESDCNNLITWTNNEVQVTKRAFDDCFVTSWSDVQKICYGNTPSGILYKNCKINNKEACEKANLGTSESPYGNKILMDFVPLTGTQKSPSECYNTQFSQDNNRCYFSLNDGKKYVNCQTGNQKNCLNFNGAVDLSSAAGNPFREITGKESVTDCVIKLESVKFTNGICYGTLVDNLNKPLGKFANCNIKNSADCNGLKTLASETLTGFTPLATFFESANDCFSTQWDSVNKVCYTENNKNEKWAFCEIQSQVDCVNSNIDWKNGLIMDSFDSLPSICPKKIQNIIFDSKTSICYMVNSDKKLYKICDFSYEDCYKLNKGMLSTIDYSVLTDLDEPSPDSTECLRFYEFSQGKCYTQDNNGKVYEISKIDNSEITEEQCTVMEYSASLHQTKTMTLNNGVVKTVGAIIVGFIGFLFY